MHPGKKKKNIISASRRTDIPAFYGDWLLHRIKEGFCKVKNPFNYHQESHVSLLLEDVTAFIFWTRNPNPFLHNLENILALGYKAGFFVTLNNYPAELEINNPDYSDVISGIFRLNKLLGEEKIVWRYDPIIISNKTDMNWHLSNFSMIAEKLSGLTNRCITSFADFYRKTSKNLRNLEKSGWQFKPEPEANQNTAEFLIEMQKIAENNGIILESCCEESDLFEKTRIIKNGCINKDFVSQIIEKNYEGQRHKGQRPSCQCLKSVDIGAYDTCKHGCLYCYATRSHEKAASYSLNNFNEKL